jgi:hypothetical protein
MKHKGDWDVCRTTFGRSFGLSRTVTTTSASTLTLNSFSTGYQIFDGVTAGQILNLGDATTYFKDGHSYFILNDSSEDIIIENSGGTDLFTLKPNFGVIAVLEDGSTANGVWRFLLFLDNTLEFVANSASPGFTWGRSGNLSSGTWLLNDTVPSNKAGRYVFLNNAEVTKLFTSSEELDTYDIGIYSHEGNETNLTLLATRSVVASRGAEFDIAVLVPKDKQLAIRITAGSAKNLTAGLSLTGTVA